MSPRKPYVLRRCHWYDDDGHPRSSTGGIGCNRSGCRFVHPDDAEWFTAASSAPPSGVSHRYPLERKERDTYLRPPSTYSNLPAETASSSSSVFPERKSSASSLRQSSVDRGSLRKDSYDNISPSASRSSIGDSRDQDRVRRESSGSVRDPRVSERKDETRREEPAKDANRREESRSERRLGSTDSGRITKDEKRPEERRSVERRSEDKRPSVSEKRDSVSSVPSLPRAIPAKSGQTSSETMPPPPIKSSTLSGAPRQASEREGKLDQWVYRIKELATAVSTRVETLKLEQDLNGLKRVVTSRQFCDMSEETQRKVKKRVADVEARHKEMKASLNSSVNRLVDTDFWPVPPKPSGNDAAFATNDEKFREMRLTVMHLKDKMKEIEEERQKFLKPQGSVLMDSSKANSTLAATTTSTTTPAPRIPAKQPEPMDVDEPRPAKRRRLSEERDQPEQPAQQSSTGESSTNKDYDALMDRLNSFEDKLAEIENEMVVFDQTISATVNDRIEDKFSDLTIRSGALGTREAGGEAGSIDTGQLTGSLHDLEVEFGQAANEIKELADTMAGMITDISLMREENAHRRTENETLRATIAALEGKYNATEEMLQEQKSEIKALNAALTAYISRPPDPVPPPILPDTQLLVEALRPSIVSSVRQEIEPMLHNLHGDVQKILVDHTAEITGNVMAKLIVVLKTQAAIQDFMEKERRAASLPAPPSEAGPHDQAHVHVNGTKPADGTHDIAGEPSQQPASLPPLPTGNNGVEQRVMEPSAPP